MNNRVLIADDESLIRRGLEKTLSKRFPFFEFLLAEDGDEALRICAKLSPSIVITDIRMPTMSGLELIKALTANNCDAAYIIISGYNAFEYAKQAIQYGVENYILKPIDEGELIETIVAIYRRQCVREVERLLDAPDAVVEMPKELLEIWRYPLRGVVQFFGGESGAIASTAQSILSLEHISGIYIEGLQLLLFTTDMPEDAFQAFFRDNIGAGGAGMAISGLHPDWGDMSAMRTEIAFAREQSVYFDEYTPLFYNETKGETERRALDWNLFYARIVRALCTADRSGLALEIDALFDEISRLRPYVRSLAHRLTLIAYEIARHEDVQPYLTQDLNQDNPVEFDGGPSDMKNRFTALMMGLMERIEQVKQRESRKIIEAAKRFIEINTHRELSLTLVAEHINMNPVYFSALFKRETGRRFTEFVTKTKLIAAENMLVSRLDMRIGEIALALGYEDIKYFNRIFKKRNQLTPSAYREKNIRNITSVQNAREPLIRVNLISGSLENRS
jgi:two-component system response regulator YesN